MTTGFKPGGAATATSNGADLPMSDIHMKMCKKVAQLTKVIYVLNTRIDENDTMIEQLKSDHESELGRFHGEAGDRLRQYKSIVDKMAAYERKQTELEDAVQVHRRREMEALARFEAVKREAAEKEREHASKLVTMGSEVVQMKRQLQERITEASRVAADSVRAKKQQEEIDEIVARLEASHRTELERVREELDQDARSRLESAKGDFSRRLAEMGRQIQERDSDIERLTKTRLDLELSVKDLESKLQSQSENSRAMAEQFEIAKRQLASTSKAEMDSYLDTVSKQYQTRIDSLLERLAVSDGRVDELQRDIARLNEVLNSRSSDADSLQRQLLDATTSRSTLADEVRRLETELSKAKKRFTEQAQELTRKTGEQALLFYLLNYQQ